MKGLAEAIETSLRAVLCLPRAAGTDPVEIGVNRVAELRLRGAAGDELGVALRGLIDAALLDDDARSYSVLVAVHDVAAQRELLGVGPRMFDEGFYLRHYLDVAGAVRDGAFADGYAHFVRCGADEGRAPHGFRPVARAADRALRWLRVGGFAADAMARGGPRLQVNVIGFLSANMGLGVTARNFIRLLDTAGFDLHLVDLPVIGGRAKHDLGFGHRFASVHEPSPHPVNLFVLSLQDVGEQLGRGFAALDAKGRINVAVPFWELQRLPPGAVRNLATLDVVVATSDFVRSQLVAEPTCPSIVAMGHPLHLPEGIAADRRRFGIPTDRIVFLSSFDLSSDVRRKNPEAALRAFELAFGGDDRASLVVKVNSHRELDATDARQLAALQEAAARHGNVHLIHEILGYADVMALCASCDVFVSLHRAEGLGLCLMEAMSLGKPVIATAWSGNLSFGNQRNTCLVDFDLVPAVGSNQAAYAPENLPPDSVWAEPSIEQAARWMRRLADEPDLRQRIGQCAQADMAAYQQQIRTTDLVDVVRRAASLRRIRLEAP